MLARIFTENKNYSDVVELISRYVSGATIIKANSLWQKQIEHSLVIEVIIEKVNTTITKDDIEHLAHAIKKLNQQDAVLVQYLQCQSKLI